MAQKYISQTVQSKFSSAYYMDLLINLDKPEDQQDGNLYYVRDEQWTKLTAKDMRTALVNAKSEQRSSSKTLMPSFNTAPSSAPIRSPMTMKLPPSRKASKGKPQLTQSRKMSASLTNSRDQHSVRQPVQGNHTTVCFAF